MINEFKNEILSKITQKRGFMNLSSSSLSQKLKFSSLLTISITLILLSTGCASFHKAKMSSEQQTPTNVNHSNGDDQTYLLGATVWFQNSGEFKALCLQAYNVAKLRLDQELLDLKKREKEDKKRRKSAIILDVDETVLDNSPYQARSIVQKKGFPHGWKEWVNSASAKTIPGALEFLQYASSKGVEIFYITNRKSDEADATYKNLLSNNLPFKKENILFRTAESSKKLRRELVYNNFEVLLLFGDNLNDFTHLFEDKNSENRSLEVFNSKTSFGNKFIVLPNPMYGDWESSVFNNEKNLSAQDKELRRVNALIKN